MLFFLLITTGLNETKFIEWVAYTNWACKGTFAHPTGSKAFNVWRFEMACHWQGSHKFWKSWKTWKITKKKFHAWKNHGIWKNPEKSWKNHRILWNNLTEPPVARKLAVPQLVFWLLVVSSFNYFKMHACSTSMLLLLHSTVMLNIVNMLLKGEVGDCALK